MSTKQKRTIAVPLLIASVVSTAAMLWAIFWYAPRFDGISTALLGIVTGAFATFLFLFFVIIRTLRGERVLGFSRVLPWLLAILVVLTLLVFINGYANDARHLTCSGFFGQSAPCSDMSTILISLTILHPAAFLISGTLSIGALISDWYRPPSTVTAKLPRKRKK